MGQMALGRGTGNGGSKSGLARERRSLVEAREARLRDLGGVVLELYRRGEQGEEVIRSLCEEIGTIESRLHAIDGALAGRPDAPPTVRCVCGAEIAWDAERCDRCGWPEVPSATAGVA